MSTYNDMMIDLRSFKVILLLLGLSIVLSPQGLACFVHVYSPFGKIVVSRKIEIPTTSHVGSINLKKFSIHKNDGLQNLREQLSFTFPYDLEKKIPRRIWQTWKVNLSDKSFPDYYKPLVQKWMDAGFQYTLISDSDIVPLLELWYHEVPLVLEAFRAMPVTILKIDFLRYLLLYAKGGIYSDLDTNLLKPLDHWPSLNTTYFKSLRNDNDPIQYQYFDSTTIKPATRYEEPGLVIGIEADPDREDWNDWYARRIQFCQWTIQAKPGHPVLRELIINITATTLYSVSDTHSTYKYWIVGKRKDDYNINYRHERLSDRHYNPNNLKNSTNVDGTDIMNWTGPGIFTDILFEYFNNLVRTNKDILLLNSNMQGERISQVPIMKFYGKIKKALLGLNIIPWEFFSLITEPVLVDDILVLPITSFSPEVNQMGSKSRYDKMAFVQHHFCGTWKKTADRNKKNNKIHYKNDFKVDEKK